MRNLMNLVKFKCEDREDCDDTSDIRQFLWSNIKDKEFPLYRESWSQFAGNVSISWANGVGSLLGDRASFSANYHLLQNAIISKFENREEQLHFVIDAIIDKLTCKIGNYGFFRELGVSPRYSNSAAFDDISLFKVCKIYCMCEV